MHTDRHLYRYTNAPYTDAYIIKHMIYPDTHPPARPQTHTQPASETLQNHHATV